MQNTYLVKICVLSEHERTVHQLVTADSESEAESIALFKESLTSEVSYISIPGGAYYSDGVEEYQTLSITLIDCDKVEYIKQLFNA